jgi:hypothetical protein
MGADGRNGMPGREAGELRVCTSYIQGMQPDGMIGVWKRNGLFFGTSSVGWHWRGWLWLHGKLLRIDGTSHPSIMTRYIPLTS